jgi:hypothetical protein
MRAFFLHYLPAFSALAYASPVSSSSSPQQDPLRPLYHYCLPSGGPSVSHKQADTLGHSFCTALSRSYQPHTYGEVEETYPAGLVIRAWWDASELDRDEMQTQCVDAISRVLVGCEMVEASDMVYGGTSEFKSVGGRVDVLPSMR